MDGVPLPFITLNVTLVVLGRVFINHGGNWKENPTRTAHGLLKVWPLSGLENILGLKQQYL